MGCFPNDNNGNFLIGYCNGNCISLYGKFYRYQSPDTNKHIVKINSKDGSFWDDIKIGDTVHNNYNFDINIYLFGSNHGSLPIQRYTLPSKVWFCKISNSNNVLRNFIPCYRKSDHKPGMYDLVSKQFYINNGASDFILGPDM